MLTRAILGGFGGDFCVLQHATSPARPALFWPLVDAKQLRCSRPHLVEFEHTIGISVTELTLRNSPFWTTHFIYSSDIFVKDVVVLAPATRGNTDGVNPDSSSNVWIENLYVSNGDDGVAIKSGLNQAGIDYGRCGNFDFISGPPFACFSALCHHSTRHVRM